ncbi:MAG: hypothetical protein CMO01_13875 [Thalassobius sp.]|nr:hypothetical protein [Thalassovita sp.]
METSFMTGSENLYKYLVSIGLLLIVMTVYYPLKEKQNLEISRINTEKDAYVLNYELKKLVEEVDNLKKSIKPLEKDNIPETKVKELFNLNHKSQISQFELERKYEEIETRKKHIKLYNCLFWVFFPIGIVLTCFGFIKWLNSKSIDDEILKLEKKKLELEISKLEIDNDENQVN